MSAATLARKTAAAESLATVEAACREADAEVSAALARSIDLRQPVDVTSIDASAAINRIDDAAKAERDLAAAEARSKSLTALRATMVKAYQDASHAHDDAVRRETMPLATEGLRKSFESFQAWLADHKIAVNLAERAGLATYGEGFARPYLDAVKRLGVRTFGEVR